ncbi:MAG: four helix bundle protein [Chloroflexota bacterium]
MAFKFEKLDVWKRGVNFADEMFSLADELPQRYQFSLGEQLRRASLGVPTNIAEGCGRDGVKEKAYFFRIAKGSLYEVVSLLVIMGKRGELSKNQYVTHYEEADEIAAMLTSLNHRRRQ